MMKFSLDFDGVITDQSALRLRGLNSHVFFWSVLSATYFPLRPGIRQIAALLARFGELQISTARPPDHFEAISMWLAENAPELKDIPIHSSGDISKATFLSGTCKIHIDDHYRHSSPPSSCRIIVWDNQSAQDVMTELVVVLNDLLAPSTTTVKVLSLASLTPTFLISSKAGVSKLKILPTLHGVDKFVSFYQFASTLANHEVYLPALLGVKNNAVELEFVDGPLARDAPHLRTSSLGPLARFLASLHEDSAYCACAIDQFNVCHSEANSMPCVIDACDFVEAEPLLDVIWAEQLLCDTPAQRLEFVRAYLAQRPDFHYTRLDVMTGMADYYSWLHFILSRGAKWNAGYMSGSTQSQEITKLRSLPVSESTLLLCL